MTKKPLYKILDGSTLTMDGRTWLVTGRDESGYTVEGQDDRECITLSFAYVDQAIRDRLCDVSRPADIEKRKELLVYTGGFEFFEQLSSEAQVMVRTRLAMVLAMDQLKAEGEKLTQRSLSSKGKHRSKLIACARSISNETSIAEKPRGGKTHETFICPQGRTLMRYCDLYHRFDQNPIVLADRDHLKGRYERRLSALQEQFIDYVLNRWMSFLQPKLAPLVNDAQTQFHVPPLEIAKGFQFPSITTIRTRCKAIGKVVETIGRKGMRHAKNALGAGATDVRALSFGEKYEWDQVYLSIFTKCDGAVAARVIDPKTAPEELEENEARRLWLHAIFDVATREALGWIISETADADHSLALLRMATRDKKKEKVRYGCTQDPAPAVGLMLGSADNGSATRNASVYASQLGIGTSVMTGRTYHASDKPYVERPFGVMQWQVLNFLPGYTGSRPGELVGYDPKPAAELTHDELYGVITRYLVDEYPYRQHRGTGMFGATIRQKREEAVKLYGKIDPPSQQDRCLHLGIKVPLKTTSEGVMPFSIPYNSKELQRFAGGQSRQVTIHMDPDDLRRVFITSEGSPKIIEAKLMMTVFNDLTLEEVIAVKEAAVKSNPKQRELDAVQLKNAIERRARESGFFPDSRDPSNYQTIANLQRRADRLAGISIRPNRSAGPTVRPGHIMERTAGGSAAQARPTDHARESHSDVEPQTSSKQTTLPPVKESKL